MSPWGKAFCEQADFEHRDAWCMIAGLVAYRLGDRDAKCIYNYLLILVARAEIP